MLSRLRNAVSGGGRARHAAEGRVRSLARRPLISVLMPVYETEVPYLRAAIESVRAQAYPDWELCVVDDGSRDGGVRKELERQRRADPRIRVRYLERNQGISAATNAALELARGEYVALLDHDDALTPDALLEMASALEADPQPDVVYSDSDKLTARGRRGDPFFKPDWSPVYALGAMYVGHLLVVRRSLAERAGGFDSSYDTIQDFEFMLRASELTDRIVHIPKILYHWRAIPGSIAAGAEEKRGVERLQARAVSEHLRRIGAPVAAEPHPAIPHRAQLVAANGAPAGPVTVVVASVEGGGALDRCLASLAQGTPPAGLEIVVVAPGAADAARRAGAGEIVAVEPPPAGASRAVAANRGAQRADGEWLLFCADAIEFPAGNWLAPLLAHAALPGVVAVGPLIARPDGRAESAGVAIGLDSPAMPMLDGVKADGDGYYGALACARDVSAVSGECMLVRADAFAAAGGFNEAYATEYYDVDLCQQLRRDGGRVVYAPRPRVITHETPAQRRARADVVDRALFVDRWYSELERGDPYFNPNFSSAGADYVVEAGYPQGARA